MLKMHPYLNFDGQAEEAFKFYKSVLGGEFSIFRMGDMPGGEELSKRTSARNAHLLADWGSRDLNGVRYAALIGS